VTTLFAYSTLPPSDAIREAAKEVISRSHYELDGPTRDTTRFWLELIEWLFTPFVWLFESLEGWPEFLRWIVVVVSFIICIALIAHIIYTFVRAIRGPMERHARNYVVARRDVDPSELENQAEAIGTSGDYIGAIRLLFRAALRRIELAEKKPMRPGCTNRELLRRYNASPILGALSHFVKTIDLKWYGGAPCDQSDYLTCRGEHAKIREYASQSTVSA
jgi:hypothetical protein